MSKFNAANEICNTVQTQGRSVSNDGPATWEMIFGKINEPSITADIGVFVCLQNDRDIKNALIISPQTL